MTDWSSPGRERLGCCGCWRVARPSRSGAAPAAFRSGLAGQLGTGVAPVLGPLLDDSLTAGDTISALRRYSLVSPPVDGSVSMHRLVQAVTLHEMSADLASEWLGAAAATDRGCDPYDTDRPETWPICAALLPHAQAVLTEDSDGMGRIAEYLGHRGSHSAARDLWQRVFDMRVQVFGPEHPHTLSARSSVAYWTGEAGDLTTAGDQFAALLPINQRVLGPEHPDTPNHQPRTRPLDRAGRRHGRRPGPVRRAPVNAGASPRHRPPGHADH